MSYNTQEKVRAFRKRYYCENHRNIREKSREYYWKNREKVLGRVREYQIRNSTKIAERKKKYQIKNRVRVSAYWKNKYSTDLSYRLKMILRTRLNRAIGRKMRGGRVVVDLGCSIAELKFYLEGKFKDGMSWANHGQDGWEIDHVIPLAFFDLTNREQFLSACHYTNLQPMWALENRKKGKKVIYK